MAGKGNRENEIRAFKDAIARLDGAGIMLQDVNGKKKIPETEYEVAGYAFAQIESCILLAMNDPDRAQHVIHLLEEILQVAKLKLDHLHEFIGNHFGELTAYCVDDGDLQRKRYVGFSFEASKAVK